MTRKNPFSLDGKIAIVTGASRGIGKAVAMMLADQGAHVVISSRRVDDCQLVVDEIKVAGGSAQAIACHIGDIDQIDQLFQTVEDEHGRLDILVNNAAANPYYGPIVDTDLAAFQKTTDVNIRGYFFMSTKGAKLMKKSGGGSIVNVASINGVIPGDMQGIYSITKAAVISMTKAFAKECAPDNIRVNALLPGATRTKFASALVDNEAVLDQLLQHVPMNRVAEPEEMAASVLYLASDASSYTTGVALNVDGGFLIH